MKSDKKIYKCVLSVSDNCFIVKERRNSGDRRTLYTFEDATKRCKKINEELK